MSAALDRTLMALADPERRQALNLLRVRPHRASDLAAAVGISAPAMSRHLRVLRECGLVREHHPEYDARVRIYELRREPLAELRAWIEETEQLWSEQLVALKAHVEG